MKNNRVKYIFLMIMLLMITTAVSGQGLPQLTAELPDPSEVLGKNGYVYDESYIYEGRIYKTFLYDRPANEEQFLKDYSEKVSSAGYKAVRDTVEGEKALRISSPLLSSDMDALLLYDFQGYMFFMVPENLNFNLHNNDSFSTPTPSSGLPIFSGTNTPQLTVTPKPTIDTIYQDLIDFVTGYLLGNGGYKYIVGEDFSDMFDDVIWTHSKEIDDFGYALKDLDENGIDELIFGYTKGNTICDIYTIKNNSLIHLISKSHISELSLCDNGEINLNLSGPSAFESQNRFYTIRDGALQISRNYFCYMDGTQQYYVSKTSEYGGYSNETRPSDSQKISESV